MAVYSWWDPYGWLDWIFSLADSLFGILGRKWIYQKVAWWCSVAQIEHSVSKFKLTSVGTKKKFFSRASLLSTQDGARGTLLLFMPLVLPFLCYVHSDKHNHLADEHILLLSLIRTHPLWQTCEPLVFLDIQFAFLCSDWLSTFFF